MTNINFMQKFGKHLALFMHTYGFKLTYRMLPRIMASLVLTPGLV